MTVVRLLLNSGFTGANAFFALAQSRGLFDDAGLQLQFTPGRGAYTAAARLADEGFDAAYGDLNALIELAALRPAAALPVAVFVVHQHAPSCISVARAGPVATPAALAGCKLVGHASDVALRTFAAYARSAALPADTVRIETSGAGMAELLQAMLDGKSDAVFGYTTTHTAALAGIGLDAAVAVRFLRYRDVCPSLYGSALMVSPALAKKAPDVVAQLVRCLRSVIAAAHAQPHAAVDAVASLNPATDRATEMQRWLATLADDIGWPVLAAAPLVAVGAALDDRLQAAINCLAAGSGWAHRPSIAQIFDHRFLAQAR